MFTYGRFRCNDERYSVKLVKPRRSVALKMLIAGMLILSWLGWLRFYQALVQWHLLMRLEIAPAPWYSAVSGLAWGLGAAVSAVTLWWGWRHAPKLCRMLLVTGAGGYWLERLLFTRATAAWQNLPFAIGLTLLWIGLALITLELPQQRAWFSSGDNVDERTRG